jgi:hypothetical protein
MPPPSPRVPPWVPFFAALAVLGAAAVTIPIVYNLGRLLRPEQVAEARRRWREHGPRDYDLKLRVHTTRGGGQDEDEYFVAVRGGRVAFAGSNDEALYVDPALAAFAGAGVLTLPPEDLSRYGVEALFDQMAGALRPGGRDYATADFDSGDGHPTHYVHRVRGTRERVEWWAVLQPVGGEQPR